MPGFRHAAGRPCCCNAVQDTDVEDFDSSVAELVEKVAEQLVARGWRMVTAESCSGGWIAKCCTDLAGSSRWFDRGLIVYSYRAKEELLGVRHEDLVKHGAVSTEIAAQMAAGAVRNSGAAVSVVATGIAGPGGGMPGKPVGLVCFGWCIGDETASCEEAVFAGDRRAVREQTVLYALEGLFKRLS